MLLKTTNSCASFHRYLAIFKNTISAQRIRYSHNLFVVEENVYNLINRQTKDYMTRVVQRKQHLF